MTHEFRMQLNALEGISDDVNKLRFITTPVHSLRYTLCPRILRVCGRSLQLDLLTICIEQGRIIRVRLDRPDCWCKEVGLLDTRGRDARVAAEKIEERSSPGLHRTG